MGLSLLSGMPSASPGVVNGVGSSGAGEAAASAAGDFGGLFTQALAGAQDAEALRLSASPTNVAPQLFPDVAQVLPTTESLRALLREAGVKADETDGDDDFGMLGALSVDVVAAGTAASLLTVAGETEKLAAGRPGAGGIAGVDAEWLLTRTANFAASPGTAAETEVFSGLLNASADAEAQGTTSAAPLTAAAAHSGATPATVAPASARLATPLDDPRWAQEFGERIVWMAHQGEQQARLQLSPAHLGPLDIQLHLGADKTTATLAATAATPEARQALEDALPRLREMLAAAGIALGDAQVGREQDRAFAAFENGGGRERRETNNEAILEVSAQDASVSHYRRGNGLVDLFA